MAHAAMPDVPTRVLRAQGYGALAQPRMRPDKVIDIAQHLGEGCGIRKTARLVGASKDGVTNLGLRLGLHARALAA